MARAALSADTEVLPEADRLDGFPHPRLTARLYGHGAADAMLAAALASGQMHHAWLITGPEGIGKATLAYRFARAALARPEDRDLFGDTLDVGADTPAARQVAALSHPGLCVIRRGYDQKAKRFAASISVDDVRRVRSFLSLSAEENGWRVVIVDSADEMNLNAANALLKSLEEPPRRTVFLIVSAAPGRLLATIRSRCRVLPLSALGAEDLTSAASAALASDGKLLPSEADSSKLRALAGGSVRRFLALQEGGGLALQERIDKILLSLPALDQRAAHALSDELQGAAQEQKFALFFDLLMAAIARLIRTQATGQGDPEAKALAARLIGPARLATFAELWETLARDKAEALALNLDRRSLILATLARLADGSRS